jgi:hypothetical protein
MFTGFCDLSWRLKDLKIKRFKDFDLKSHFVLEVSGLEFGISKIGISTIRAFVAKLPASNSPLPT